MNLITHNLRPILFDDFINDFFGNINQNNTPLYNIFENDKEYKIEFSVPGFDKKHFSVEIENDILRVSNTSEDEVSDKYYKRQFNYSNFSFTSVKNKNAKITPSKSPYAFSLNSNKGVMGVTVVTL